MPKGPRARTVGTEKPAAPAIADPYALGPRPGSVLSISRRRFHRIAYVEWGDPQSDRVVM